MSPVAASRGPLHVVVGANGQIGAQVMVVLERAGARIRAVTRNTVGVYACEKAYGDIGDPAQAERLCSGADIVYACFGGPHISWSQQFPRMTRGLLAGAARAGARVIFADNLYAYGPQRGVLAEDTPVHPIGRKPMLRAQIAESFLAAHRRGDVPVKIARASDLYGPGIENAMVSASLVASALAGRPCYLPGDLDAPHTFSFAPDVARAMVQLALAGDGWGEIWHMPSAPALSLRSLLSQIGSLAGRQPRVIRIPTPVLRLAGMFDRQLRELLELSFQWDRPYLVSHAKLTARFGLAPTSIEHGLRATRSWLEGRQSS